MDGIPIYDCIGKLIKNLESGNIFVYKTLLKKKAQKVLNSPTDLYSNMVILEKFVGKLTKSNCKKEEYDKYFNMLRFKWEDSSSGSGYIINDNTSSDYVRSTNTLWSTFTVGNSTFTYNYNGR